MRNIDAIAQEGSMAVWHLYTAGIALEEFLLEIKKGRFVGRKCPSCGMVYLPPRIYCEICLEETESVKVKTRARLVSWTKVWVSLEGERLSKPEVIGFFNFEGTKGGIFARIKGEVKTSALYKPKLKVRRKGSITDIDYFSLAS